MLCHVSRTHRVSSENNPFDFVFTISAKEDRFSTFSHPQIPKETLCVNVTQRFPSLLNNVATVPGEI